MNNLSLYIKPSTNSGGSSGLITILSKIGDFTKITPTAATIITGLDNGSHSIVCADFVNAQVEIFYGNVPIDDEDMGDGGMYFTKVGNTITFSQDLFTDDKLKIKIFPL